MRVGLETVLISSVLASTAAFAAEAPILPADVANNANDLQRAVWACEGGASSFEQAAKDVAGGQPRFFLSTVDASAKRNEPPLTLKDNRLTGLGSLSNDKGWFNIRFECTLSADLRQPTAFKFETLSPVPNSNSQPSTPGVTKAGDASQMSWSMDAGDSNMLTHGLPETDDQDFSASCAKGSGEIKVDLTNTLKWLKADSYVTVSISDGPGSGLYVVRPVMDDGLGAFMPELTISAKDPLADWIARGTSLLINIGSEYVYEVSLKGSAKPAKAFASACRQ